MFSLDGLLAIIGGTLLLASAVTALVVYLSNRKFRLAARAPLARINRALDHISKTLPDPDQG